MGAQEDADVLNGRVRAEEDDQRHDEDLEVDGISPEMASADAARVLACDCVGVSGEAGLDGDDDWEARRRDDVGDADDAD